MNLSVRLDALRSSMTKNGRRLGATLGEAEVARFEAAAGIRLPEDYRRFVTGVGNGATGGPPEYGLMRLGELPRDHHRSPEQVVTWMREPFPLTEAWVWESDDDADPEAIERVERGVLHLGTEGCGMYWVLVVTGEARGTVWLLTGEGAAPCVPPRDFVSWLEAGLEAGAEWPTCVLE